MQKLSFYRTIYGVVANIILNFLLIPKFGAKGASLATVISQLFASYLSLFFNKKTFILAKNVTLAPLHVFENISKLTEF